MSFTKDSDEFKMFGDFYNISKKHWNCDGSPRQCEDALNDIEGFCQKYKDSDDKTKNMSMKLGKSLINFLTEITAERKI